MKTGIKYSLIAIAAIFVVGLLFSLCKPKEAKGNSLPNAPHVYLSSPSESRAERLISIPDESRDDYPIFIPDKLFPLHFESIDCWHDSSVFRCVKYLRNYDGDTISFDIPYVPPVFGKDISIRLLGIDAPEIKTSSSCEKKLALEAKLAVKEMLTKGTRIELHDVGRDKYFRLDANVVVDGKSVSEMLLNKGLAYPYSGGHKPEIDWCKFSIKNRGL